MSLNGLHILVVEDHEFQRHVLLALLRELGASHVQMTDNGHSALEIVSKVARPLDVIVSDLDMPGMDGIEFIRHLGQSGRRPSLLVVSAIDGSVLASLEAVARACGVNLLGVIEKPASVQALETLLLRHRAAEPEEPKPPAVSVSAPELEAALARGEFLPFFQPQAEMESGRIVAFEALARWHHPERGLLSPADFLPMMEGGPLIDELTWVMLEQSAAACVAWRQQGRDLRVSVNLSVDSLRGVGLADRVTSTVIATGLEPRHMTLEVTESAAAGRDVAMVLENLSRLRLKGFGLAIDDYGTGYSSMQQLARVAFTELKVDRSFVANSATNESGRIILASCLSMAQQLRLVAVAEGVETAREWATLHSMGCSLAQGYFIAAPMAARRVEPWLRSEPGRSLPPGRRQPVGVAG